MRAEQTRGRRWQCSAVCWGRIRRTYRCLPWRHRPDLILKRLTLILSASGSTVDGGQMHADDRCVDHLHSSVLSAGERAHDLGPNARSSPANEAIVASGVWAGLLRQVAPWRSRSPAG